MVLGAFIVFFGVLYYGFKIGGEKAKKIESDSASNARLKNKEQWLEEHTNTAFEKEMQDFVRDYNNYERVRALLEPELEEMPRLKRGIKLSNVWYQSSIYPNYWMSKSGNLTKRARESYSYYLYYIESIITVLHGVVPSDFGWKSIGGFQTPDEVEFFRWCVKKLRVTAGIVDPVIRMVNPYGVWAYALQPLASHDGQIVSDDQILSPSPQYTGSAQPTSPLP